MEEKTNQNTNDENLNNSAYVFDATNDNNMYTGNPNNGGYNVAPNNPNMNNNNMYTGNPNNGGYNVAPNNPNMNNNNMYTGNPNNNAYNATQNINYNMYSGAQNNNENVLNDGGMFDTVDIQNNKSLAYLSYIFPFIPYFFEKNSKWVRFHALQGMNFFIIALALMVGLAILSAIFSFIPILGDFIVWLIGFVTAILSLGILAFMVMGCINVYKGEAKKLPIIGNIKILKR